MNRIDAHHHLWSFNEQDYDWITPAMAPLRRDFLLPELKEEMRAAGVQGAVAVQARQTLDETDWLLQLAQSEPLIAGVVGWLPLASAGAAQYIDRYASFPQLKGVRHVVQAEPAGFLEDAAFHRGVQLLHGSSLVYDLLLRAEQLPEATAFVDRHPDQAFVLDHLAKPEILTGQREPWTAHIRELARRPHVTCKVSGLVTEADPAHWTEAELRPYFDVVLEAFGPHRLMVGTDWPVLTLGCGYGQWWETVERWIDPLTMQEQELILADTAVRVYQLQEAAPAHLSVPGKEKGHA